MGDSLSTPLDVALFLLIFIGIPMLLLSFPLIVLGILSRYQLDRRHRYNLTEEWDETDDEYEEVSPRRRFLSTRPGWLSALLLVVMTTWGSYLVFGTSMTTLLGI